MAKFLLRATAHRHAEVHRDGDCYIVDDDLMLGSRWTQGDVDENTADSLGAIVTAFLTKSPASSISVRRGKPQGRALDKAGAAPGEADGVKSSARPASATPALLGRPEPQKACDAEGVAHINFQFTVNRPVQDIGEQVAFSDSIKLWV
ncbi:MAG: hypothetical protein IPP95_00025 [Flavobacteriales bacterium]|nr:MAG: hypothetical protein IPP95_00025 [Flavobacteriales bacterium]